MREDIFSRPAAAWSRSRGLALWCRALAACRNSPDIRFPRSTIPTRLRSGVGGARTTEGVLASEGTLKPIALSGNDAPGIFTGTFVEFDAPAINNWDEVAFVATVRRGRETFQALYLYSGGKLRKLVAEGDRLPPPNRGTFDKFGVPAINNKGVVAFPAVLEHAAVLGGIFLAGTRDLRLLLSVGDLAPSGAMLVRFSERVAINDEDNVALGAQLRSGDATKEAILLVTPSGLVEVAAVGDSAPGGGTFAAFGPWPSFGPGDTGGLRRQDRRRPRRAGIICG